MTSDTSPMVIHWRFVRPPLVSPWLQGWFGARRPSGLGRALIGRRRVVPAHSGAYREEGARRPLQQV